MSILRTDPFDGNILPEITWPRLSYWYAQNVPSAFTPWILQSVMYVSDAVGSSSLGCQINEVPEFEPIPKVSKFTWSVVQVHKPLDLRLGTKEPQLPVFDGNRPGG